MIVHAHILPLNVFSERRLCKMLTTVSPTYLIRMVTLCVDYHQQPIKLGVPFGLVIKETSIKSYYDELYRDVIYGQ